jgi:hypothetical protein
MSQARGITKTNERCNPELAVLNGSAIFENECVVALCNGLLCQAANLLGVFSMKKFLLSAILVFFVQSAHAQLDDGIYVIPEFDSYAVVLSNGDIVQGYLFFLDGNWTTINGSRVGDTIEFVEISKHDIAGLKVSGGPLGVTVEQLYCNPWPDDDPEGCKERQKSFRAFPVLKANGTLKAIYQTQYGADLVLFESDGIAVIVSFEMGNTTADRTWIGAYTASISEDLAIFNIEAVVESDDSDGEVILSFEAQISDRVNPQAEFRNFTCEVTENDTQGETCERIQSTYFSKLIRKF